MYKLPVKTAGDPEHKTGLFFTITLRESPFFYFPGCSSLSAPDLGHSTTPSPPYRCLCFNRLGLCLTPSSSTCHTLPNPYSACDTHLPPARIGCVHSYPSCAEHPTKAFYLLFCSPLLARCHRNVCEKAHSIGIFHAFHPAFCPPSSLASHPKPNRSLFFPRDSLSSACSNPIFFNPPFPGLAYTASLSFSSKYSAPPRPLPTQTIHTAPCSTYSLSLSSAALAAGSRAGVLVPTSIKVFLTSFAALLLASDG